MSGGLEPVERAPGDAARAQRRRMAGRLVRLCLALGAVGAAAACTISDDEEREIGSYEAAQTDSAYALVTDTAINQFVTTLGRSLASRTSRAGLEWHFAVVNTPEVNGFSLPGGYVYVTRGLIETADRFDELAGVMGHEIGHVVHRHSVKQLEKEQRRDAGLVVLCTVTSACSTVGNVLALRVGADAVEAKFSRTDEAQADSEAVVITLSAGIDPEGVPAFFRKMLEQRSDTPTPVDAFFASHPTDEARISALSRQIDELGSLSGRTLERDTPEFHAIQARIRSLPAPPRLTAR